MSKARSEAAQKPPKANENKIVKIENAEIVQESPVDIGKIIKRVSSNIKKIEGGYLAIVGDVAHLYALKAYEQQGYANIYDMCADLWGMSRGTTHNLLSIARRYCAEDYTLTEAAQGKKVTELLKEIKEEKKPKIMDKSAEEPAESAESDAPIINIGWDMTESYDHPIILSATDLSMIIRERFGGLDNAIKVEIKIYTQS